MQAAAIQYPAKNDDAAFTAFVFAIILIILSIPSDLFGLIFGILVVIGSRGGYHEWAKLKTCIKVMYILAIVFLTIALVPVVVMFFVVWIADITPEKRVDKGAAMIILGLVAIVLGVLFWLYQKAYHSYTNIYGERIVFGEHAGGYYQPPQYAQ